MICSKTFATKPRRHHHSRFTIAAALILASLTPAWAQYWTPYENSAHGFAIDAPPGFVGNGTSGDEASEMFYDLAHERGFTVWAGQHPQGLEAAAREETQSLIAQNWLIDEETSTPQWAAIIAQRDHRLVVERFITLCSPQDYAAFRMEFHIRDMAEVAEFLTGMTASFQPTQC